MSKQEIMQVILSSLLRGKLNNDHVELSLDHVMNICSLLEKTTAEETADLIRSIPAQPGVDPKEHFNALMDRFIQSKILS